MTHTPKRSALESAREDLRQALISLGVLQARLERAASTARAAAAPAAPAADRVRVRLNVGITCGHTMFGPDDGIVALPREIVESIEGTNGGMTLAINGERPRAVLARLSREECDEIDARERALEAARAPVATASPRDLDVVRDVLAIVKRA